jgi:hypothetical protein
MNDENDSDSLFLETEPPLPEKGAELFGSREDWHLNACLNYIPTHWQWDWYADGYKAGADRLVEHVDATNSDQDILLYPVVFLYRHYLEVRLKELLLLTSYYLDEPILEIPPEHDLMKLWKLVRPRLERVWPRAEYHDEVGDILRQFCRVDGRSIAFRYPLNKDGTPTLADIGHHINLGRVRDAIAGVATILDGSSIGLNEYINAKNEMASEYRAEAEAYEAEVRAEYEAELQVEYAAEMRDRYRA